MILSRAGSDRYETLEKRNFYFTETVILWKEKKEKVWETIGSPQNKRDAKTPKENGKGSRRMEANEKFDADQRLGL